jgi:1-acyl-sn-glycerol-3-phosphate acyltransferase
MTQEKYSLTDWLATSVSVGGVLSTLAVYDVLQRVAIRFGDKTHQRVVSSMARNINRFASLSAPFRVIGEENIDRKGQYIFVSNHQSMFDISIISGVFWELAPRYVSKLDLAKGVPGVSYNLRHGGSALINRDDPGQAQEEISSLGRRAMEKGFSVVIFPEGTRSKTGRMRSFRETGLRSLIAAMPGVPIIPSTSSGGSRFFSKNLKPIIRRDTEVYYQFHAPIPATDPSDKQGFTAFVRQLEDTIRSGLPVQDQEPI